MNNEVESYVGELRELRKENESLKTKLKFYETELAWSEHYKQDTPIVDWDMHSMIVRYPDRTRDYK